MSKRIVSIGEAMVEMAPSERAGEYRMSFAGDTFNTAWYAKKIAQELRVDYVTRVGQDDISNKFLDVVKSHNLGADHIATSPTETMGLYMISLNNGERSFSYWRGQAAAKQMVRDEKAIKNAFSGADIIYFSGITLGILDAPQRAALFEILKDAKAAGSTIAFDSNLRPKLWDNTQQMCDVIMQAASVSDVVLPSYDDEAQYFGDENTVATIVRYQEAGATTIVVKNGDGMIDYSHGGKLGHFVPNIVENLVDTTAAGDSFNAGFLANFVQGVDIAKCIQAGSELAAKVIQKRGALVEIEK